MKNIILDRYTFREQVFKRDNFKCVICSKSADDAHHIIDRHCFTDGSEGYYIDNGVSLCNEHHIDAETTIISCQELREKAGIKNIIYPDYLNLTEFVIDYDKWGNPIYKNNKRGKGYFFFQENAQKMLKQGNILYLFENEFERIVEKYPRSYHLLYSKGTTSDDRINKNNNIFLSGENIITEKLDGSNSSANPINFYGRSRTEATKNPWDTYFYSKYELIKKDLKAFGIEICFESLYGEHSIIYSKLEDYCYVFGVRNFEHNVWLSWEETEYYAELFDFKTVPVLFKSDKNFKLSFDEFKNFTLNDIMTKPSMLNDSNLWNTPKEGFVVRLAGEFHNDMFYNSLSKFVRQKHVKTDEHWIKNWKRAKLYHEIKDLSISQLKEIYKTQIEEGLINI